jgi:hypothetical protein
MDGTKEANATSGKQLVANPQLAAAAVYCAAWASESLDRYADKPHCFTNYMSVEDLILVVIEYISQHPSYRPMPFLAVAAGAVLNRWPDCARVPCRK